MPLVDYIGIFLHVTLYMLQYFWPHTVVRDSSAVRWLFFGFAAAVGRQRAIHKENSGFASPTLGRHIFKFCGYQILFSIRNPYINRFTNHFSIHS
jgi:hypothetical protein